MFVYFVSQQDSGDKTWKKDICVWKKSSLQKSSYFVSPRKVDIQTDLKQPLRQEADCFLNNYLVAYSSELASWF